mmetsp:Transcript_17221/g.40030  ORF Transcript_17221/g.40030 Transcript_17221/m.40030 type:complete len:231 (+) Transcript_17221:2508-3200(+)
MYPRDVRRKPMKAATASGSSLLGFFLPGAAAAPSAGVSCCMSAVEFEFMAPASMLEKSILASAAGSDAAPLAASASCCRIICSHLLSCSRRPPPPGDCACCCRCCPVLEAYWFWSSLSCMSIRFVSWSCSSRLISCAAETASLIDGWRCACTGGPGSDWWSRGGWTGRPRPPSFASAPREPDEWNDALTIPTPRPPLGAIDMAKSTDARSGLLPPRVRLRWPPSISQTVA